MTAMPVPLKNTIRSFAFLVAVAMNSVAQAAESGETTLVKECQQCHALEGPAPQTLKAMWERKGPDLFYAGNKYKPDWMIAWLQKPTRIRPAGMFYGNHIQPGKERDEVDETTLVHHPVLTADKAKKVTAALMKKLEKSNLVEKESYQQGRISISMGEMMFDKFKGCLACHQIEPGYGGLSGPEVYSAAKRLQDGYLLSVMRNPKAWDPMSFMPNKHLKEKDLQKFTHYFKALSQEDFK